MNKKWLEPAGNPAPESLRTAIGGHPLVAQVLFERGLTSIQSAQAFLNPDAFNATLPSEMPGITQAADRVERAIHNGEKVCVWGDFDVDGQTSTTLMVSTLRELGAQVTFHIPVRERESHGVSLPVLKEIHARDGFTVVVTCDTGISAHESIAYAKSQGIDFVVTDHHELPPQLPAAAAIANPRLLPVGHPASGLPGVGTAYKLAQELFYRCGKQQEVEKYLDLVALGIVADVAQQTGEARYLLQRGLEALRCPNRPGLKALYEMADLNPQGLTEEHISFILAPRLNALGRLSDANSIVEFFTTSDFGRARVLANQLEGLNARRKLLTDQVFQAAQAQLELEPGLLAQPALVLSHPSWPAGVIGIVASRMVERYNRPTILISTPVGEVARGSARSVEGFNITTAIADQAPLLLGYGGHAMAAGLAIEAERIPEFRRTFCRSVEEMLGDPRPEPTLRMDGYIPISDLTPELVMDFERLAPFGAGNPALTLCSPGVKLRSSNTIGRGNEHVQLILEDDQGFQSKVIWWQGAGWDIPAAALEGEPFDLAYHVRMGNYRGSREIQIEYVDLRLQVGTSESSTLTSVPVQVIDERKLPHPLPRLKLLLESEPAAVWGEAEALDWLAKQGLPVCDRYGLIPALTLAIWTIPPGRPELEAVIKKVAPSCVYLFGTAPETEKPGPFLKRLAGLVKFAIHSKEGRISLSQLAAATAHREVTVRKGLAWLEAAGHIHIEDQNGDRIQVRPGVGVLALKFLQMDEQLKALLEETAAFRRYYLRAHAPSLVEYENETKALPGTR